MRKEIFSYLKIAAQIAVNKGQKRSFCFGAIAVRNDGAIVRSFNSPTPYPSRKVHAEYRITKRCDVNSVVYVARVHKDGNFAMARPCNSCIKAMKSRGIKRCYFSVANDEFGRIDFI